MDNDNITSYDINFKSEYFVDVAYRIKGVDPLVKQIHSHDGFEVLQTWSSEGYILIDNQIYPIQEGALYLVNGINPHSTNPMDESLYTRNKIVFSKSYILYILERLEVPHLLEIFINADSYFYLLSQDEALIIDKLFMEIYDEMVNRPKEYSAYVAICLIKILIFIKRFNTLNTKPVIGYPYRTYINEITSYITQNLLNFNFDRMCEDIHISKYYACHIFKRITGITVMRYVLEKRISLAKIMLLTMEAPISQIALETGFSSFSIFSRAFKRIVGVTPLEYRKSISSAQ